MLISYEPNTDILTIAVQAAPVAQTQMQGAANVGFDAMGNIVSVVVADASTVLWEHGGQVQIALPQVVQVVQQVVPIAAVSAPTTTVVETTRVVERTL